MCKPRFFGLGGEIEVFKGERAGNSKRKILFMKCSQIHPQDAV